MFKEVFAGSIRKLVVTGHYGSGKTEFAVSLAMLLASGSHSPIALIDLDIVNPYFRSRERRELLTGAGVMVYGSVFDEEITAELPALGAAARSPLEDEHCRVIIDLGGNDTGAMVINQFAKYFTGNDTIVGAVVNANRPDTSNIAGVLEHIGAIETATGLAVTHVISNTHMLHETTANDIHKGHALCCEVCDKTGRKLLCECYPNGVADPAELSGLSKNLMPLGLYMRPTWLKK